MARTCRLHLSDQLALPAGPAYTIIRDAPEQYPGDLRFAHPEDLPWYTANEVAPIFSGQARPVQSRDPWRLAECAAARAQAGAHSTTFYHLISQPASHQAVLNCAVVCLLTIDPDPAQV